MNAESQDADHLTLLSIFHYIVGGIIALFSCIPIFHVVIGTFLLLGKPPFVGPAGQNVPPMAAIIGLMFVLIGGAAILFGWTCAGLLVYAGRCLSRRRKHLFCTVVAGIACIFFPFGTALGVFTLIVLMRPAVKALFR